MPVITVTESQTVVIDPSWTSVFAEAWGAGGDGGTAFAGTGVFGGGGGGGAYAKKNVLAAGTYLCSVPEGNSSESAFIAPNATPDSDHAVVLAVSGTLSGGDGGGNGGAAADSVGDVKTSGGNGEDAGEFNGSGGNGANGGGLGGAGGIDATPGGQTGNPGNAPGGGGAGGVLDTGITNDGAGGAGARGEIRITYTAVVGATPQQFFNGLLP